jgi:hypothetical protein
MSFASRQKGSNGRKSVGSFWQAVLESADLRPLLALLSLGDAVSPGRRSRARRLCGVSGWGRLGAEICR